MMETPQKLRTGLPYDPATRPMGIYPMEIKIAYQKDMYFHISCQINHRAKIWKQPKCSSTGDSIMKTWYIQTTEKYPTLVGAGALKK